MLLICLADVAIKRLRRTVDNPETSKLAQLFENATCDFPSNRPNWLFEHTVWPANVFQLIQYLLDTLCDPASLAPRANAQTFGAAARGLQPSPSTNATVAIDLFARATEMGVPADGRFLNAVLRCCGNNLVAAVALWKDTMRKESTAYCATVSPIVRKQNLKAVYNGLLYVSGRAYRPDIALRFVYALRKEDIEPDEGCLNSYRAGCREENRQVSPIREGVMAVHESLLVVECTKFDLRDRRRQEETRVRIILPSSATS